MVLIIAFLLTLCNGIILFQVLKYNVQAIHSIWLYLCLFAVNFGVVFIFIKQFIYQKIKRVYNSIFPENKDLHHRGIMASDKIEWIESQASEWSKKRDQELTQLRFQENYQKEFIGNLAHELKTPIFNIQGYVLTLLEGGLEDKRINRQYLKQSEKSIERMIQILEDLDTITQFDSDRINLKLEKLELKLLIEDIIQEFKLSIEQSNKKIRINIDTDVQIVADKKKIKQVIINLLNNSLKYGKENGKIEISASQLNHKIIIKISDDGPGIEEKHLSRIFERFYRIDESRSRHLGGSGLGLAIVKSILDAHGEPIRVNSKMGVGTTFSFTLPQSLNATKKMVKS